MPKPKMRYAIRDRIRYTAADIRAARFQWGGPMAPWSMIWRSVVPGWTHFRAGQRIRGLLFFWSFLACLLPGLLLIGTGMGSLLLGFAFSIHASAFADMLSQYLPTRDFRSLMINSLVAMLALAIFLYVPLWWAMSRVAAIRTVQISAGSILQSGDVVVVNHYFHRSSWPQPGTVVLYDLPFMQLEGTPLGHERRLMDYEGERVDRVLAVGGDKVQWKNNQLYINGKLSNLQPLNPSTLPKEIGFTATPGSVVILPSTTTPLGPPLSDLQYAALSCIPREKVEATVYLRLHPLSRIGLIY
ncbi:MAG TPA: S26 family signal peptidase [Tepidisphaeraceae bacterium]|jgi:signal peptidase I